MTLPFDLPRVSLGYALLTPPARETGRRASEAVGRALAALTGCEVRVSGRPVPCVPAPRIGAERLRVELAALPGTAAVEVEASLAVALLDRLAGGPGRPEPATSLTPLERSALELAALASLDALATLPEVEERLAPRLARAACEPRAGLAVDLSITLGDHAGRARAILPAEAVRALGAVGATPATAGVPVELSLRSGSAALSPEELAALEPGDVVLVDREAGRLRATAPGGLCFRGVERADELFIEEIQMPEASLEYPIALEIELARLTLTLGDLYRLEPGAVLPLPIDRRGIVTLKLGDRTLGRGELVDVEGAVGVRIDSLTQEPR